MMRRATGRFTWAGGTALAGLVGTILLAGPAWATQVNVPKANPVVTVNVPDGWTVEYTELGLELRSPEKDSVVVATVLKRAKGTVDVWKQKVLTRLEADGVTIGKGAKAPAAPAPAATAAAPSKDGTAATPGTNAKPAADAKSAADAKTGAEPDLPGNATTPSFSMAGGPSLATPSLGNSADNSTDKMTITTPAATAQKGQPTINGLSFQSYRLEGGMFKDKPTDIQLALFSLPKNDLFVIEQQSAPEDNRAAAIMASVKKVAH